jgi:hypothetical protein
MRPNLSTTATIAFAVSALVTISTAAQTQSPAMQQHQDAAAVQMQTHIPEVPPETARRIEALRSSMQPSAKAWVEQQAHLESQKQTSDAPSIEAAVYNRFPALNTRGSSAKASDINALVAIVMMEETNDSEKDLQNIMSQVQAINNAKQQLRNLLSQVQAEAASNRTLDAKAPCQTALCKSLPASLGEISTATANLQKPVRISIPAKLTFADVRALPGQLQSNLDGMNEMSEMTSMRLQMAMDRQSKFVEALSNIMKKIDETNSTIIQNIK